jgi:integral membrane protein
MSLDLRSSLIDRLRLSSLADGLSYLVLLGIAMPLKYMADMPLAVRIVGSLHGAMFVALSLFLLLALIRKKLSFGWCVIVFLCALVPFAPFVLDRKLKEKR